MLKIATPSPLSHLYTHTHLDAMDTKKEITVHVEPMGKNGFYYKTKIKIERVGKADMREYVFPHLCLTLDHVHTFFL